MQYLRRDRRVHRIHIPEDMGFVVPVHKQGVVRAELVAIPFSEIGFIVFGRQLGAFHWSGNLSIHITATNHAA